MPSVVWDSGSVWGRFVADSTRHCPSQSYFSLYYCALVYIPLLSEPVCVHAFMHMRVEGSIHIHPSGLPSESWCVVYGRTKACLHTHNRNTLKMYVCVCVSMYACLCASVCIRLILRVTLCPPFSTNQPVHPSPGIAPACPQALPNPPAGSQEGHLRHHGYRSEIKHQPIDQGHREETWHCQSPCYLYIYLTHTQQPLDRMKRFPIKWARKVLC